MQTGKSTLERPIELAKEGSCRDVAEICRKLKVERHDGIDQHLSGRSIMNQLRKLVYLASKRHPAQWL